jgi:hypothetical protein
LRGHSVGEERRSTCWQHCSKRSIGQ